MNVSLQAPDRQIFSYAGSNRSKKNVVDVFSGLHGERVSNIRIADRERQITIEFENGDDLTLIVFGPKANVFWSSNDHIVGFRGGEASLPELRPAPSLDNAAQIESALSSDKSLGSLLRLFPKPLIQEMWHLSRGSQDPNTLFAIIKKMENQLANPTPCIYWNEERKPLLSMIPLEHLNPEWEKEVMSSVDEGVRISARRRLAVNRFSGQFEPLIRTLKKRMTQAERSLGRVEDELEKPSRADRHEHYGHLLMAQLHSIGSGEDEVILNDILTDGAQISIVLDPRLSPVENAQSYYERAKRSRQARVKSRERIQGLRKTAQNLKALYDEALSFSSVSEVVSFKTKNEGQLKALMSAQIDPDAIPYRRYVLDEGYEVWVGRNAKQNDQLTLKDARKFDLWLHARGVAGSHTVLRLRGKMDKPPKYVIEQAAAIAAFHSKARSSSLAPVIVAEKKFVRKPRKSLPGTVIVERERVVMVEPSLPK